LGDIVSEHYTPVYTELKGFGMTCQWSNLVFCTATCPVGPKEKERQRRCEKILRRILSNILMLRTSCNKS